MSRGARVRSESGVYHVVLRGINKQTVFFDDEDRKVFLNRIKLTMEKFSFQVYAFCLMSNHVHLVIKEEQERSLGNIFRSILSSFVSWYNLKYKRCGNLFQDRFRSEPVETDDYLLCAVRYVHQNPIKANMVSNLNDYKWSSHSAYINQTSNFVNSEFVLSMLGGIDAYIDFMRQDEQAVFAENDSKSIYYDEQVQKAFEEVLQEHNLTDLSLCRKSQIEDIAQKLKIKLPFASIRQLSRVTKIPIGIIRKNLNQN